MSSRGQRPRNKVLFHLDPEGVGPIHNANPVRPFFGAAPPGGKLVPVTELGTVIAKRELEGHAEGKLCKVTVEIGMPVEDQNTWYCPYRITTPKSERLHYGAGADSLQALSLTILMIGVELSTVYADLNLAWFGQTGLGFSMKLGTEI